MVINMVFSLISPTSSKKINVDWLEVQTDTGSLVIKNGHAPMIVILAPNREISIGLENGSTTLMTIAGGILEVDRTTATLLLSNE